MTLLAFNRLMETKSLLHNLVLENVFCGQKLIANEQDWIEEREKLLKLVTHSHSENLLSTSATNCLTKHGKGGQLCMWFHESKLTVLSLVGIGIGEHIEETRKSAEKQLRLEVSISATITL